MLCHAKTEPASAKTIESACGQIFVQLGWFRRRLDGEGRWCKKLAAIQVFRNAYVQQCPSVVKMAIRSRNEIAFPALILSHACA